ncbi:hypothetical protein SPRA44_190083 [Serratia proteamaculans]|nr:hypothetical protein SPRA44_190083 [Serratia proteamaculans]
MMRKLNQVDEDCFIGGTDGLSELHSSFS